MDAARADDKWRSPRTGTLVLVVAFIAFLLIPVTGLAQSGDDQNTEQLAQGQQVYTNNCSSCHQPSGLGLSGAFPPLKGNPRIEDTDYLREVIQNGLSGPIEVNGETYDAVMPSFGTLDDDQVDAVIAFLQNDLVVPGGTPPAPESAGPVAGTTLPAVVGTFSSVAYLIAIGIALWVLAPRIIGVIDRRSPNRLDAALKGGLIVVYFATTTVFLPSLLLSTEVMTRLPRGVQDFVATAIWAGALGIGILGLWWFQREKRI